MRSRLLMFLSLLVYGLAVTAQAESLVTREYHLQYMDAPIIIRAINITVQNPGGRRIMSGQDKRLVVTDAMDQQERIADLLPIIDLPSAQSNPDKILMEMVTRTASAMRQKKIAERVGQNSSPTAANRIIASSNENVKSYDVHLSTQPYKSVYSDEDAQLMKKPRVLQEDPPLPSLSALTLKGIFRTTSGSSIALLSFAENNFVARDGGLFDASRNRLKGVSSQVKKDYVILTGPDRIPLEIRFKSSL